MEAGGQPRGCHAARWRRRLGSALVMARREARGRRGPDGYRGHGEPGTARPGGAEGNGAVPGLGRRC